MNIGKVPENILKRSVLKAVNSCNRETKASTISIGQDTGCFISGDKYNKISIATVFGDASGNGKLSVFRAVNNLASEGVKATGITVSVAVAVQTGEEGLKSIISEITEAAKTVSVSILLVNAVFVKEETVITVNAFGPTPEKTGEASEKTTTATLVMFGNAGNAGAAMLCAEHKEDLSKRFTEDFLSRVLCGTDLIDVSNKEISVWSENGLIALQNISEGGVFGAAWELCERLNLGCNIDLFKIPVIQATIEVCEFLDINPYILRGDGAFLAAVAGSLDEAYSIAEKYNGTVIGTLEKSNNRVLHINEEIRQMEPNRYEEYYRVHR